jgi:transglutaminase-like putative cysteine protease
VSGFACAVVFLLCQPLCATTPDWVRQAAAQPVGTYDAETNAVVLVEETNFTVSGNGQYVEHYRRVVSILRPEGRKEGKFNVTLEKKDKLLSVHAWSISKSGHDYELKEKDFPETTAYSYVLYEDTKHRVAEVSADPGFVVAFEYEVRRQRWLNQLNLFFQEDIPVREAHITLALPLGWKYKASWAAAAPVQPVSAGEIRWEWILHDIPGIEPEAMAPPRAVLSGRMSLTYFDSTGTGVDSWEGLGQWYAGLTAGRREATPEIIEKTRQLTVGKTDFGSRLGALASFLQSEVRYVAIIIGVGGYQPHAAGDVFRARYGDCKDKVTLLSAMLRQAGIYSHYLLIDSNRGFVDPAAPSALFDHAILAIELPEGISPHTYQSVVANKSGKQYLLFDPTDQYTPVGELRPELQDSYALLITDSGGELIRTPRMPPETNILARNGQFTLSSDGTLSGEVREDRSGNHALRERARLLAANQRERLQLLERSLSRSFQGFMLQHGEIQNLDNLQENLLLRLRLTVPQYGQLQGSLILVRPCVLGQKSFHVDPKPRHYPVQLGGASRETDSYEIEIPPGYKVDDVPDAVKLDVGFASYQSHTEVSGSKLRYWREYVVRDFSIGPDHFPDWKKLQGVIGADEFAAIVLSRVR